MWAVLIGVVGYFEGNRWLDPQSRSQALTEWLSGTYPDYFPFLPFILLFPLAWWGFRSSRPGRSSFTKIVGWMSGSAEHEVSAPLTLVMLCVVGVVSFGMSWRTGLNFAALPPAYHDEYSYLIQAETYLHGRWANPEFTPQPELFDQVHVLNEGQFASRYFPGTGAWIAPFLALGNPWLGHQVAQALCAMLIFLVGRELSNNGTGLLAGLLFALSPGLILFSNLLLAHHPTMLGLCLFLWAFLRGNRTGSLTCWLLAGCGLSFAMLCRPMTAAAFGLPFGIVFAVWWFTGKETRQYSDVSSTTTFMVRTRSALALGLPLVLGFLIVFISNKQITGSYTRTPYELYLDTYTPRHVYGFNNVIRGEQKLGPKVLQGYDGWAQNLTMKLATHNVKTRIVSSMRWTLGLLPLLAAIVVVLVSPRSGRREWLLIPAAIISLHVAHIPYWFEGIMGWHYVFETAPLWILLMAEATHRLFTAWRSQGHHAMCWCWAAMLVLAIVVNHSTVRPVWPSPLERAIAEVKYPRQLYASFRTNIEELRNGQPAIVFVIPDPSDISMDYVTNPATLSGAVLVARIKDQKDVKLVRHLFPERNAIVFNAKTRQFEIP